VRVTVLLFARLREIAGTAETTVELDLGSPTIADVWAALVASHPGLAPHAASMSCARNAEYARMHTPVAEGDEVAFLPPVSGGDLG
jgi:molybdopterin converting factor subunit 1